MEETVAEYNDLLKKQAWLGEYTVDALVELIDSQFSDYIALSDNNNYVAIFYEQVDISRRGTYDEEFRPELNEAIDNIVEEFVSYMMNKLALRFNVRVTDYESGRFTYADIRPVILQLYEFFVLNARSNFIDYFTREIPELMMTMNVDVDHSYDEAESLIELNTPLIKSSDVLGFLKNVGEREILEMYQSNDLTGNFLQKYSPHFHNHEDLRVIIVTNVASAYNAMALRERNRTNAENSDNDPDT